MPPVEHSLLSGATCLWPERKTSTVDCCFADPCQAGRVRRLEPIVSTMCQPQGPTPPLPRLGESALHT